MRIYKKSLISSSISFLVAITVSDTIFAALDIDYHIFHDASNAGKFVIFVGITAGLFVLTNRLLERLPYFRNKGGG